MRSLRSLLAGELNFGLDFLRGPPPWRSPEGAAQNVFGAVAASFEAKAIGIEDDAFVGENAGKHGGLIEDGAELGVGGEGFEFGELAPGNVGTGADEAYRFSVFVAQRSSAVVEPTGLTIGKNDAEFHVEVGALAAGLHGCGNGGNVIWMDSADHIFGVPQGIALRKAEQALEIVIEREEFSGLSIPTECAGIGRLQRNIELFALLQQGRFRLVTYASHFQMGLHAGQQFARTKGLDEVVVGALLDALNARFFASAGRK